MRNSERRDKSRVYKSKQTYVTFQRHFVALYRALDGQETEVKITPCKMPITVEDVPDALASSKRERSPGLDSHLFDLYVHMQDLFGELLKDPTEKGFH